MLVKGITISIINGSIIVIVSYCYVHMFSSSSSSSGGVIIIIIIILIIIQVLAKGARLKFGRPRPRAVSTRQMEVRHLLESFRASIVIVIVYRATISFMVFYIIFWSDI